MSGKSSATSWTLMLMATLLFGVGLGFSLGRAIYLPRAVAPPPAQQANASPEVQTNAPANPPHSPPVQPVSTQTAPAAQASLPPKADGYWGARHLFVSVNGQWLADATKSLLREVRPGGVLLQDVNLASRTQTFALVKEIKTATGLGEGLGDLPLIAVAQEGGALNLLGLEDAPSAQALGENGDLELARSVGQRYGEEAVGRGIGIVFAPVLDVYEPGAINPGFAARAFGTEHTQVARMALAMADGLRQGGVLPVVKHFPGYGAATYGSDGLLVALNKDAAGLGRLLYPFDQAVRRGVPGMLVAHVAVPALDPEDPRRPAAFSPVLVTELLRERWGYEGVIVADDVAMNSMTRTLGPEQAAVKALAAGCDAVIMIDPDPARIRAVHAAIAKAVEDGTLSREKLQQSVARLDRWQQAIGNLNPIKPNAELERVAAAVPPLVLEAAPPSRTEDAASPAEVTVSPPSVEMSATTPITTTPTPETSAPDTPSISPPSPPAIDEGKSSIEHTVREGEDLAAVAQVYSVTVDDLVRWNALTAPTAAPGTTLTVLLDEASKPVPPAMQEKIAAAIVTPPAPEPEPVETPPAPAPVEADTEPAPAEPVPTGLGPKLVYTVVEGDTLDSIAGKYSVSKVDITRWNGLESESLTAGRTLTLFLPVTSEESAESPAAEAGSEPASEAAAAQPDSTSAEEPAPEPKPEEAAPPPPNIPTETYVVQPGDTISKIARQFNTTRETVLRLNGIKDANEIKSGQKLKVPETESADEPAPATP